MTIVTSAVNTFSTTDTVTPATGAFTPAGGDLLVAFLMLTPGTPAVFPLRPIRSSVNVGRWAFDMIGRAYETTNLQLWLAIGAGPFNPASQTLSSDLAGTCTGFGFCVYRIPGFNQYGRAAIRQWGIQNNGGAGAAPAVVLPGACLTSNPVLVAMMNSTNPAALTPPAGFTETIDSGYATPTTGGEVATANSGITASTITWGSNSATASCAVAVELDLGGTFDENDQPVIEAGRGGLQ